MKTIIKVENLSYGNILDNINLAFYENQIHYISGSNNCGKNTFMEILSGKIDSTDTIFYKNKDISKMSSYEVSKTIQTVNKINEEFNFTIVNQELLYSIDQLNLEKKEHKERYQSIISLLDLKDMIYMNTSDLNDYQRLKLLLAKALIVKPKVLLLGNVLTYIRKEEKKKLILLLKKISGLTVIIFSNDLSASLDSDYLHLFHKGKLILSGETIEVLKKDSIINKLGLDLPFMVDLSLKLKYYNLVEEIELDMNRMVNHLWK